jgi:hypothetical protein
MSDDWAAGQPPMPPGSTPGLPSAAAMPPVTSQAPDAPACPWCSASLDEPSPERCPACGARLVEDVETAIPGVTTLDPALLRAAQAAAAAASTPKRGFFRPRVDPVRDETADLGPASLDALAPPSRAVLEEMRRLRAELDEAAAAAEAAAEAAAQPVQPIGIDDAGAAQPAEDPAAPRP